MYMFIQYIIKILNIKSSQFPYSVRRHFVVVEIRQLAIADMEKLEVDAATASNLFRA